MQSRQVSGDNKAQSLATSVKNSEDHGVEKADSVGVGGSMVQSTVQRTAEMEMLRVYGPMQPHAATAHLKYPEYD